MFNPVQFYEFGKKRVLSYADADVNNFISNSLITNKVHTDALNYLIVNLKSFGLWTKIIAIYPMVGTTEFNHKFNAKNPIDSDSAYRINFIIGKGTHDNNGYTPVFDTNEKATIEFYPDVAMDVNSNAITVAIGQEFGVSNTPDIQSNVSTSQRFEISVDQSGVLVYRLNGSQRTSVNTDSKGVYTSQRISSTQGNFWKNGVKVLANGTANGTLPNVKTRILTDKRLQVFLFHYGLTDTETTDLHNIISTYENMLGRKTW